ncbi:hypothetical protein P9E76_10960 [Schinkia azotoformans]|uniref:Uncharacterized protein n=1 Tax=Schinkia azotoformans LMG 9581 TaxID=1131731 RepID=K6DFT5_SCHAZ|nr:hypothetical protein [Schinkia azotoformans]EKN67184.1 hypothetical protein BAZO_10051 [Schinkia azotoformans LMG 9581]MEC1640131.1 hypothetical protein [Schinkia azotoformans]MEC1945562.1 hypothetical protein [Schinkia azotoformans]
MIGNKYLKSLFEYPDEDTSLNQLLELLKSKDTEFIGSLREPVDLDQCDDKELEYLTKVTALMDYYLQIYDIEVPSWFRDEKLMFDKPYYHSKRISDFERLRLQYTSPAPFRTRNVFFDLNGIERV